MTENRHPQMGAQLARLRRAESLTQAQLADRIGTAQSHVAIVERGRVGLDVVEAIAANLNASIVLVGHRGPLAPEELRALERLLLRLAEQIRPDDRDAIHTDAEIAVLDAHTVVEGMLAEEPAAREVG